MNFLGIGPGEIVLIVIVLLVVVGPERLPELSRQAGRMLVRGRNWIQNKPEMELVAQMQKEFQGELAAIRAGLREVQIVRDEVMDTARQLSDSLNPLVTTRSTITDMLNPSEPSSQEEPANGQSIPSDIRTESVAAPDEPDSREEAYLPPPATVAHQPMIALPASQLDQLSVQIQAIMEDLRALQQQLQQRGVLDSDWTPPSHGISLPQPPSASQPEEVA